jgi:tetratricopeptide (TPR) repeat protein
VIRLSALALITTLASAPVRADDLRDQARAHYRIGQIEFQAAHYDLALAEFRASYAAAPIPELLYDIGRCQEELGDRAGAGQSYRQYLAAKPAAEERAELERHVAELEHARSSPTTHSATPPVAPSVSRGASRPLWRRGWFWAAVVGAAVVVAGVVTLAVVFAAPSAYDYGFPPITVNGK